MSSKRCGHQRSNGGACGRRIRPDEDACWQHRKGTRSNKSGHRLEASVAQDLNATLSLATSPRDGPQRLPRPTRYGLQGRVLDDDEALRWLVERTRVHTAGNTAGLTAYQVMRNYHGIAAVEAMTVPGSLPHGARAVFAGGTCLALGHKLVERYSEDIDVVIAGCEHLSPRERDEVLDALIDATIRSTATPHVLRRRPELFAKFQIDYPRTIESDSDTNLYVVVDAGFADDLPERDITPVPVETYLSLRGDRRFAQYYNDLSIPAVPAVKPRVTMAEKLIALHQRAATGQRKALAGRARDVMDIGMLAVHEPTLQSLTEEGATIADYDARQAKRAERVDPSTRAGERLHTRRPPGGFADSPAWQTGHPMHQALNNGYNNIGHLIYDRSKKPAFRDVIARVHAIRDLL